MRHIRILSISVLLCIFSLCVAGCSNISENVNPVSETPEEAAVAQIQYSEPLISTADSSIGTYSLESNIPTDEAVVISSSDTDEYYALLYFTDSETNSKIVLCNTPDCRHIDESCNAFFYSMMSVKEENGDTKFPILDSDGYVFLYSGKLYVVDAFGDVTQMNTDGTNHKVLASLDSKYSVINGFYYNEKLYFYVWYLPESSSGEDTEFSDEDYTGVLLEVNLSSGKCKELFSFKNEPDTSCLGLYNNRAYFYYKSPNTLAKADTQQQVDDEKNSHDVSIYYYDLDNPICEFLKENLKSAELDGAVFDKSSIYYHNRTDKVLMRMDLDTEETEIIASNIDGYIEIETPVSDEKLYFMKDNALADAFSSSPKENEYFYVDLNTKEVTQITNN